MGEAMKCGVVGQRGTIEAAENLSSIVPILNPMDAWLTATINWLSLPEVGLTTLGLISFLAATWLPLGSEAALVSLVAVSPDLLWPAWLVATLCNTLGGMVSWTLGAGLHRLVDADGNPKPPSGRGMQWGMAQLDKIGPKACLLAWAPVVGDVICTLAGWRQLPPLACALYMAVGKGLRYGVILAGAASWFNY